MRLSEDRINSIATKIATLLIRKRFILTKKNLRQVTAWVEKPILDDLAREADIDAEVTDVIAAMPNHPPEGSFDYQALFQKKKEEIARRRDYKI